MGPTEERQDSEDEEPSQARRPPVEALLWTADQLASALAISVRQVWRMDSAGKIPQAVKLGRLKRWRRDEILGWVEAGCPDRREWQRLYWGK